MGSHFRVNATPVTFTFTMPAAVCTAGPPPSLVEPHEETSIR